MPCRTQDVEFGKNAALKWFLVYIHKYYTCRTYSQMRFIAKLFTKKSYTFVFDFISTGETLFVNKRNKEHSCLFTWKYYYIGFSATYSSSKQNPYKLTHIFAAFIALVRQWHGKFAMSNRCCRTQGKFWFKKPRYCRTEALFLSFNGSAQQKLGLINYALNYA